MSNSTAYPAARAAIENSSSILFQRQWRVYRKVLDCDLMEHSKVYGCLHRTLLQELSGPFRFLDVACGDASASVGALRGTCVTSYHGIDLSGPALAIAREQVMLLPCAAILEQADFAEALARRRERADVIWLGQSLHHLDSGGKLAVMRDIRRLLDEPGLFLLWEPTRYDEEDRDAWLVRFETRSSAWLPTLSVEEWAAMVDHVRIADYPETVSAWLAMGCEAGFAEARELLQAPYDLGRLYCFRSQPS